MNELPDNDPATPMDPVTGGLREIIICFSDWLETKAPNNEKSYRILKALASESLKKADRDVSQRRFDAEEITAAMGEETQWTRSLGHNEWLDWNKTAARFIRLQETDLQEFARQRGLNLYPMPRRNSTRGGPGNKASYEIVGLPIPEGSNSTESLRKDVIRYTSAASHEIKTAWFVRMFFRQGKFQLTRWKRIILIFAFVGTILTTLALTFATYIGLMQPKPVTTREVAHLIGMFLVPFVTWFLVIKPFIRLLNDRIIAAPELFLALDETPAQLELYKAEDERVIRFVRHFGYCMICGAEVNLDSGEPDFPRRLVGRCSESPREHVFSFDRVTRKGYTLRGYA